ncbi:MAG: thiamine phosphate synthase [Planctomycetaceae bacterium]|nr:thiamine phosphate synthase [Planctomycetaceae bacterium]
MTDSIERILDAAANRCREGLRVVEDYCRFIRNDPVLSEQLKKLRHQFRVAYEALPVERMLASRDTRGDVGTGITTPAETVRLSTEDLLQANCKRIQESLRSLEEYSKVLSSSASQQFEAIRYAFYTVEQSLRLSDTLRERLQSACLYLLLTEKFCQRDWKEVAREVIAAGVDVIQLREKNISDRELLERARWLRDATRETSTLLIINDRPDLARLVDADGVHVGQDELPVTQVRQLLGSRPLIGLSTHNSTQVEEAVALQADYIGVGPVFPSRTKSFADFPGLEFVRNVQSTLGETLPWFPIGGVTAELLPELLAAGALRVAVCEAILGQPHPGETVQQWKALLGGNAG